MAIEIEKKYRIDEKLRDRIIKRLNELGAVFSHEQFEENYLHRGGVLDKRSATLRLRKIGDETLFTYKEKIKNDEETKHKIEYETHVANVEEMEQIIGCLGFRLDVIYEKRRQVWRFDSVEVVLDELPFGLYMEIEGDMSDIEKAEALLEIHDLENEKRGYPRLTMRYGEKNGSVFEARFGTKESSAK